LGGSVSPVDALSLLIEFLTIAGSRDEKIKSIGEYPEDQTGEATIGILSKSLEVLNRITGNSPGSLGLHPAVYFYNERGKYSRFLFLGLTSLIAEKIRSNDGAFFKAFARGRERLERFLVENKSLLGIILQNMGKGQRVPKMSDLFKFLVAQSSAGLEVKPEAAIEHIGLRGRIFDVTGVQTTPHFTDDTKSMAFVRDAIASALKCPLCKGLLDPKKSVSYDHKIRVADGGTGDLDNVQLVHPYCNSAVKN
jgi:HNH endonuclease